MALTGLTRREVYKEMKMRHLPIPASITHIEDELESIQTEKE